MCLVAEGRAQTPTESFDSFRKGMLSKYDNFRKTVLEDYDRYLDGVWKEYETFAGRKRDTTPKPKVLPRADVPTKPIQPTKPAESVRPTEPAEPSQPVRPTVPTQPTQPTQPVSPTMTPRPSMPATPEPSASPKGMDFTFYGMMLRAPLIDVCQVNGIDGSAFADAWRKYKAKGCKAVTEALKTLAVERGLNDWFTFQMVRQYANAVARSGSSSDRVVLQHYLLANMGYNIRLARTEGQALLLVPVEQTMYSKMYMTINKTEYYLFTDEKEAGKDFKTIYSCDIPTDIDCGRDLNVLYDRSANINVGDRRRRTLTDGHLTVEGEVNVTLMEMLRHYPQMDIPCYAGSCILPPLHRSIIGQLRSQIEGLSQRDAANRLIHFVQYAFDYATDDEQHGYEKAYFLEENFYYPKNDCEDRAIFYAFLVRNLLDLDVHLVHFPGHECTAVNFTDSSISGDGYIYEGKRFTICDPTYIGAEIGLCMPNYKNSKPEIELW